MLIELLASVNLINFFHFAGIIIGLGAVTVIDCMGFISKKSKSWTQVTIAAHHVTKVLIMFGFFLIALSFLFLLKSQGLTQINVLKLILLSILIVNGCFLFFHISPILDTFKGKNVLLPKSLQRKIAVSMIISFISWWTFVLVTLTG